MSHQKLLIANYHLKKEVNAQKQQIRKWKSISAILFIAFIITKGLTLL